LPSVTVRLVIEASIIQGRQIGAAELDQVRHLLASHPDWSRRRLSEELATVWDWRNGAGQLKDMAARSLFLKLEQRGWLKLPPRRTTPFNRMRQKRPAQPAAAQALVTGELKELLPLQSTDKEIIFTLDTDQFSVKARFDPKEMIYRGMLAV